MTKNIENFDQPAVGQPAFNQPAFDQSAFNQPAVSEQTLSFIRSCANAMALCAKTGVQEEMVAKFKARLGDVKSKPFSPNPLPYLRNLHWVKDMKLARDFREFAPYLPWKLSPRMKDRGEKGGIVDFGAMFELGDIINGLMYVDAEQIYQEHNHQRHEMYFLISGTGEWRWGGHHDYQTITAGNVIYNHPWNWHGVKAGAAPVLAMFLLT